MLAGLAIAVFDSSEASLRTERTISNDTCGLGPLAMIGK
jgi:hypothetical protein